MTDTTTAIGPVLENELHGYASVSVDHAYEGRSQASHDLFAREAVSFERAVRFARAAAADGLGSDGAFWSGYAFRLVETVR